MDEKLLSWLHKVTSALVVATIIFMASNWYNTGRHITELQWELAHIKEAIVDLENFHNQGARFTWGDGQELKALVIKNTEALQQCRERMNIVEYRLGWKRGEEK